MPWDLRPIAPEEVLAFGEADRRAFHVARRPADRREPTSWDLTELDRTLAAFDGEQLVGAGRTYSMELAVPGGVTMPTAGVSWIGVQPTHRRRGILGALMRRQLDDAVERGEPALVLTASEGGIYRRFGYGVATWSMAVHLATERSAFLHDVDTGGRLRLVDEAEAARVLPGIFDCARRSQPGSVSRPDEWWEVGLLDPIYLEPDTAVRFYALHEPPDRAADAYVAYSVDDTWLHGVPAKKATVCDMVAPDPRVRARLWRYVCDLDLVTTVASRTTPVDDPLRWLLVDGRQLNRSRIDDWLWLRLVDVPAALGARSYATEARMVIEVNDELRADVDGRYELDGGPSGAECVRTTCDPDLVMRVSELGAAYLGGVSLSTLARAGLVEERTSGALARADAMFAWSPLPFCGTWF